MDDTNCASHEAEIKRCAEDFVYFCETYVKINHYKLGLIPFILYPYQKRYVQALEENRFVIAKKFRQGGFSLLTSIWGLWRCMFKTDESFMFLNKTDREAIYQGDFVKRALDELPDWLKPKMGKCNDHMKEFADTGCKMFFYQPAATKGRAITYLFIDEAAFIADMNKWWKCVWPTISTGGYCCVQSTPNGTKNWFHDTYVGALKLEKSFKIFTSDYTEHPDYSDTDWGIKTKQQLGAKGWRQEVLQEFLEPDKRTPIEKLHDAVDYCEDMSATEELVESFNAIPSKRKMNKWTDLEDIELSFEEAVEEFEVSHSRKPTKPAIDPHAIPRTKPEGYTFKNMTAEEQKEFIQKYESASKTIDHPEFDDFELKDIDDVSNFWQVYAIIYPEYEDVKQFFLNCVEDRNKKYKDMEDRVNEAVTNDMFAMAGLLTCEESKQLPAKSQYARPDLKIVDVINNSGKYPKELKISFSKDRLCINHIPTVIKEDDVRDLYNGVFSLIGYDIAIETAVKAITDKLDDLFGEERDEKPLDK